jgi:hypothetical protein
LAVVVLVSYLRCLREATLDEEEAFRVNLREFHGGIEPLAYVMDKKRLLKPLM